MINPIEVISDEEMSLANELHDLCTVYGEERRRTLGQSAVVLKKMGELYLRKADESEGMSQKLSFIRASALLNGAKVRFRMTKRFRACQHVDEILNELDLKLLQAAKVAKCEVSLLKISKSILHRVKAMREMSKLKLAESMKVTDDLTGDWRLAAENKKVAEITQLMQETCENYKKLMQTIASECHAVMGKAPCAYVLIGLGSMARTEITLYSDFEHVIALQNGVQSSKSYPDIQEYFRWFAVVFQIIIIALGETFIRSVSVKSISDLYSADNLNNWFFDVYTPCGIAFDGMVPHSCNNPLGKQESSKIRHHVVELIQPASLMAKYLTYSEDIKNGYYLKDILSRTCFLYGNEKVYDAFLNTSREILQNEGIAIKVLSQLQKAAMSVPLLANLDKGLSMRANAKTTIYRPVTANLSYIARIYDISSVTSFNIISELRRKDVIDDEVTHQLEFALAIACEIRQKMYEKAGHQRHWLWRESIVDLVGKSCAVDVLCYTRCLESATYAMLLKLDPFREDQRLFQQEYKKRLVMARAEAFNLIGCLDEAQKIAEEHVSKLEGRDALQSSGLARIYELQSQAKKNQRSEYLQKAEKLLKNILATTAEKNVHISVLGVLSGIYQQQGNQVKMENATQIALDLLISIDEPAGIGRGSEASQLAGTPNVGASGSTPAYSTNPPNQIKTHARENDVGYKTRFFPKLPDISMKYTSRLHLAVNQNYSGTPWKARETLSMMRQEMISEKVDKLICMDFGTQILIFQMRKEWAQDAILTLDLFLDANETRTMPEYEEVLDKFVGVKLSLLQFVADREKSTPRKLVLLKCAVQLCESHNDLASGDPERSTQAKFERSNFVPHAANLVRTLWATVNNTNVVGDVANEAVCLFCVVLDASLILVKGGANLENEVNERKSKVIDILEQNNWIYSLNDFFVNYARRPPIESG